MSHLAQYGTKDGTNDGVLDGDLDGVHLDADIRTVDGIRLGDGLSLGT